MPGACLEVGCNICGQMLQGYDSTRHVRSRCAGRPLPYRYVLSKRSGSAIGWCTVGANRWQSDWPHCITAYCVGDAHAVLDFYLAVAIYGSTSRLAKEVKVWTRMQ